MLRSISWLRGVTALVAVSLLATSVVEAQQKKQQPSNQRRGQQRGQQRQRSGGGFGGFGGRGEGAPGALQLIGREEVRKELKISEEQQGIIRELQQSARPDFRALLGGNFRDLSREERE